MMNVKKQVVEESSDEFLDETEIDFAENVMRPVKWNQSPTPESKTIEPNMEDPWETETSESQVDDSTNTVSVVMEIEDDNEETTAEAIDENPKQNVVPWDEFKKLILVYSARLLEFLKSKEPYFTNFKLKIDKSFNAISNLSHSKNVQNFLNWLKKTFNPTSTGFKNK